MKTYHVKDWQERYETHESRKLKSLGWVAIPNKMDGLGFRTLAANKDRCDLFSAWTLILQVASRSEPKDKRGFLERDGNPITPEQMELITGFPAKIFERAFAFFSSPSVNWLVATQCGIDAGTPGESAGTPGNDAGKTPLQDRTGQDRTRNGKELPPLPEGLKSESMANAWNEWIDYRDSKGKPVSPLGAKRMFKDFTEWGEQTSILAIHNAIKRDWQGIFKPKPEDIEAAKHAPSQLKMSIEQSIAAVKAMQGES